MIIQVTPREWLATLTDTFLVRTAMVKKDVEGRPNRYGHVAWTAKMVPIQVIDIQGIPIDYNFLLKLLRVFKQTRVHTVEVEKCQDGLRITFGRAIYILKGIGDG